MTGGFRSAWGSAPKAPEPPPAPPSVSVRAPERPVARNTGTVEPLARQIAQALTDECEARELTLPEFASLTGVGLSSVRAHRYGQGLRVDTLQKYAETLGWGIVIQDANGQDIGRL